MKKIIVNTDLRLINFVNQMIHKPTKSAIDLNLLLIQQESLKKIWDNSKEDLTQQSRNQILFSRKAAKLAKCNTIYFLAFLAALREILKNIFVKKTKFLGVIEYII